MARWQARYAQRAWKSLIGVCKTGGPNLKAQGVLLLVHILIAMRLTATARLYLLKLCSIIDEENLQFLPIYGYNFELSERVREDAAVLSQTVHLENYLCITLGGSAPTVMARTER